ncbi:DUF2187 family protein [Bacillus sp. GB_SG_008]|uniref:DUF2187 family protein n=1 Tax=Bacillus sp. GB_SG_008 TaxID=3454627 RepID=UPI003F85F6EB
MEKMNKVNIGDYVQFSYRDNPSLKLTGYVVNVLINTVVVDVSEMLKNEEHQDIEARQVVKHDQYKKIEISRDNVS